MTPALGIVLFVLFDVVVTVVVLWKVLSRREAARQAHLDAMAPRLGARVASRTPIRLDGTRDGRDFSVHGLRSGTTSQHWSITVETAVAGTMEVQIQRQTSDLGARIAGDQHLGDAAFDAACFLRTSDVDRLRRALGPDLPARVVAVVEDGYLDVIVLRDGRLRLMANGAVEAPSNEARISGYVDLVVTLGGRLERA